MKTVISLVALFAAQAASAAPSALFTMSNDRDSGVVTYSVDVQNDAVAGFVTSPGQNNNRSDSFSINDIAKPNGVVVLSGQGHNVLFLQGSVDKATGEGRFHLKYLSNGLSNTYSTCDFLLKKSGSNYFAQNAYTGARITSAKIVTWSLGLKTLQGICQ